MLDGRKWRAVPFLMLFEEMGFGSSLIYYSSVSPHVVRYSNDEEAFQQIKSRVDDYQNKIITGFDNLGFLVSYRNGRLRLGPALGGNHKLENDFYNGSADKTRRSTSGFVTVSRNNQGLQYEVEQLEFLINKKEVSEEELQKFFEENPHFLASHRQGTPIPYLRFAGKSGNELIPDFVVRPVTAHLRDSNWEVLDLKIPSVKLMVGKGARRRFSQQVCAAIAQLRDYGDYFRNPMNEDIVRSILSHHLRYPKLAVLIGRMPGGNEVEALERVQQQNPTVKIITYDEILESGKSLLV